MSAPGSPSLPYTDWVAGLSARVRREPLLIHREDDRPLVWTVLGADGAAVDVSRLPVRAEVRGPGAARLAHWSLEDGTAGVEGAAVVLLTAGSAEWAWSTGQFALAIGADVLVTCPVMVEPPMVQMFATGTATLERVSGRRAELGEALRVGPMRRGAPRARGAGDLAATAAAAASGVPATGLAATPSPSSGASSAAFDRALAMVTGQAPIPEPAPESLAAAGNERAPADLLARRRADRAEH